MYVYIYIYIYIYICMCVCVHMYRYICIYIYIYICMYIYMYICVCIYMYMCVYICMYEELIHFFSCASKESVAKILLILFFIELWDLSHHQLILVFLAIFLTVQSLQAFLMGFRTLYWHSSHLTLKLASLFPGFGFCFLVDGTNGCWYLLFWWKTSGGYLLLHCNYPWFIIFCRIHQQSHLIRTEIQ